jgi:hypothetical protein
VFDSSPDAAAGYSPSTSTIFARFSRAPLLLVHADTNAKIRGTRLAGSRAFTDCPVHAAPTQGRRRVPAISRAWRSAGIAGVDLNEMAVAVLSIAARQLGASRKLPSKPRADATDSEHVEHLK